MTQLINQVSEVVVPFIIDHFLNPPERKEEDDDPEADAILDQSNLPPFPVSPAFIIIIIIIIIIINYNNNYNYTSPS